MNFACISSINKAIILYVDDLIIAGNSRASMDQIKREFYSRFEMKDLVEEKEVVGIKITRKKSLFTSATISLFWKKVTVVSKNLFKSFPNSCISWLLNNIQYEFFTSF